MSATAGTVLITGASGTLGTALAAHLEQSDWRVVCLSRAPLENPPQGAVEITGDFTSRDDLTRVTDQVGQIAVCVHLAGVLSEANGQDLQLAVNVVGTHALLTHLRDHGTPKFILASSIAAVGCLSPTFRPLQLPMPDDHTSLDPLGYGGSKYLMEEMSRLVSRQNPSLDIINLRIAGIQADDTPPRSAPEPDSPSSVVQFGIMYEHDMMRCLHLAIDAPPKPGVRVLNAAAQHATVPEGASVAEILRGGADEADSIPGLAGFDAPGHGDDSVFDVRKCYEEIGFLSERRVEVLPQQQRPRL